MSTLIIRQVFDWTSEDRSTKIHFRVSDLLDAIAAGQVAADLITTPLQREWADSWLSSDRCDELHVRRLMRMGFGAVLYAPVLSVAMADASYLLIDGAHRYRAHLNLGHKTIDMMLVALSDWQPYAEISSVYYPPLS